MSTHVVFAASDHEPDEMSRQKRFERSDEAANIHADINPHYFQTLSWLYRLRFLTTEQVGRLLDPPRKRTAVFDLLRRMYDGKLITRLDTPVKRQWGSTRTYGATRAIHCLDLEGARFLADRWEMARSEIDWKPRDNQRTGFLDHTLATNTTLITMYLAAKKVGWSFDIIQTERDINKQAGGHDKVQDTKTRQTRAVKADAVCRLTLTPSKKAAYMSLEVDMGTEPEKKIKQKLRLHRQHYTSGLYEKRHGTKSNRIPFVVADVRDPELIRPIDEAEWQERVRHRVGTLKRWAEEEEMQWHFWFAPSFELTEQTIWQERVWYKVGESEKLAFI
jgi:hypothetical protein